MKHAIEMEQKSAGAIMMSRIRKQGSDVQANFCAKNHNVCNHLINQNIQFLKKKPALNCKLYTDSFVSENHAGRELNDNPKQELTITDVKKIQLKEKDYKYYCRQINKILKNMKAIAGGDIDILDAWVKILELTTDVQIDEYLKSKGMDPITPEENTYIGEDLFFRKIYSFVKLYYTLLESNDYDNKKFKYFYLTDRRHYIDVLKLTVEFRKIIAETEPGSRENFIVPRYLKIAALFHDIERYSKGTQYESLTYMGKSYDKIRKKVLHPLNTIAIINILYENIPENTTEPNEKKDLLQAANLIKYHDIPLSKNGSQESIVFPETKEIILEGMKRNNSKFVDLKSLIIADSIALFRNTYPYFIIYIKNKSKPGSWQNSVLDRLNTSLKKIPMEYQYLVKDKINDSIKDFQSKNPELVGENLNFIHEITERFFQMLPDSSKKGGRSEKKRKTRRKKKKKKTQKKRKTRKKRKRKTRKKRPKRQ